MDGRGPSIWDKLTHEHSEVIADSQNGDIGPDSYHFYEEDIKAIKSLGVSEGLMFRSKLIFDLLFVGFLDEILSILYFLVESIAHR